VLIVREPQLEAAAAAAAAAVAFFQKLNEVKKPTHGAGN
jgi:hypothetical protein